MTKTRWIRLWVLLSGILIGTTFLFSVYYIWGRPACYRIVSITISEKSSIEDYALAKEMQGEGNSQSYCGKWQYSRILTLEDLAKRNAVTQIAFQWLEPDGWSMDDHDMLDIENRNEIKTSSVINDTAIYVHKARLSYVLPWIGASILLSLIAFGIGWGIGWVRRG